MNNFIETASEQGTNNPEVDPLALRQAQQIATDGFDQDNRSSTGSNETYQSLEQEIARTTRDLRGTFAEALARLVAKHRDELVSPGSGEFSRSYRELTSSLGISGLGSKEPGLRHSIETVDPTMPKLSWDIWSRAMGFVDWLEAWDGQGAKRITRDVAIRSIEIANLVKHIAGEPFLAPAGDGSIQMKWRFGDDSSISVYVESDAAFPDCFVMNQQGDIAVDDLRDDRHLLSLLEEHSAALVATD